MAFMNLIKPIILGSGSPRRHEIFTNMGIICKIIVRETDESFEEVQNPHDVPEYLALKKLSSFDGDYQDHLVICADTVVIVDDQILNKPNDVEEATAMLKLLSGTTHLVITGVAIRNGDKKWTFKDTCKVTFAPFSDEEIAHYIETCKPFDKAGAYGIQDFAGLAKVSKLEGSYYTVMGLPAHLVYEEIKPYIKF